MDEKNMLEVADGPAARERGGIKKQWVYRKRNKKGTKHPSQDPHLFSHQKIKNI